MYKPKHIEKDYIAAVLLKIFPTEERLNDFINGKLYMNTSLYYSYYELYGKLSNGQFDALEGTQAVLNATEDFDLGIDYSTGKLQAVQCKKGELPETALPIVSAQLGRNNIYNIYCLYSIWFGKNDNVMTAINSRISEEFGTYYAIILNKEEFYRRIEKAAKKIQNKLISDVQYKFVNYVDTKADPYVQLGPFKKDKEFVYQNEFRITLQLNINQSEVFKPLAYFEVGNLSDIIYVGRFEELKNIKYENNAIILGHNKIPFMWV